MYNTLKTSALAKHFNFDDIASQMIRYAKPEIVEMTFSKGSQTKNPAATIIEIITYLQTLNSLRQTYTPEINIIER